MEVMKLGKYWTHIPQYDEYDQDTGLLLAIAIKDEKTGIIEKSFGRNQLYNLELINYKKGIYFAGCQNDIPVYIKKEVDPVWLENQINKQLECQRKKKKKIF